MASKTRSGRKTGPVEVDVSSLTNIERLLLAQAVYEFGSDSWNEVSKLLSKHPLLTRPKTFFTPHSCNAIYSHLMKDAGLERSEKDLAVHSPVNLKLAQKHYQVRMLELRDLIAAEEARFKTLVQEIDEIRSGSWDDKIIGKTSEATEEVQVDEQMDEPMDVEASVEAEGMESELTVASSSQDIAPEPSPPIGENDDEENTHLPEAAIEPEIPTAPTERIPDDGSDPESDQDEVPLAARSKAKTTSPLVQTQSPEAPEVQVQVVTPVGEIHNEVQSPARPLSENKSPGVFSTVDDSEDRRRPPSRPLSAASFTSTGLPVPWTIRDSKPRRAAKERRQLEELARRSSEESMHRYEYRSATPQEVAPSPLSKAIDVVPVADQPVAEPSPEEEVKHEPKAPSPIPEEPPSRRRESKRKTMDVELVEPELSRDKKRARDESEPVEEEETAGPSAGPSRRRRDRQPQTEEQVAIKRFQNIIGMVHSQISQHRNGAIFHNPIRHYEAPDYHDIVKRPMDLKTIKGRIKDGVIGNSLEFQRDIYLMFANAMMYNRPGSDIYKMTEEMMGESEKHINEFRQTEGLVRSHRI
ncbi:hypothetical protein JAAARDRAFT_28185 [Jaapia argillacea MUCL 33604]|uniref:Bromo domain-containing protein n=1 Tax=Jaapia argillacea MUCL 33604 TaxID=933084 RepID=A0A067QPI3_9AGAM|nr:hypothetical protein JAAARDRAFT_28185 [Jaapia argillacea MUCL 33604]